MFEYLAIAGLGWFLGNRGKPALKVEQFKSYGPKTGVTWDVERYPDLEVMVVSARGTRVAFRYGTAGTTTPIKSSGDPRIVTLIQKDFLP